MSAFVNKCPKCGTKVKIRSRSLDGRKARCPRCSAAFRIKAPPKKRLQTAPARKPPSVEFAFLGKITDDDLADFGPAEKEFDDFDDADANDAALAPEPRGRPRQGESSRKRPHRKEAASSRNDMLIGAVVIGLGLLLLAGGGFFALRFLPGGFGGGAASRLAWMPDDIEGFLEIEPDELWQARALRPLREAEAGVGIRDQVDKLLSPVVLSDVDRIAVGFPPPGSPQPEPVFVLYAKAAFDEAKLTSQAAGFEPASHGGKTYYVDGAPIRAAYFAASDVIVCSTESQVKAAIDRAGVCAAADQFELPGRATIVFAARNPQRFGTPSLLSIAGPEAGLAADANGLSQFAFAVDVAYDFAVSGTLSYESAETAETLVADVREQVEKQSAELEFQRGEKLNTDPTFKLNLYGVKQFLTAQQELLRSVDVSHSGGTVSVEFTIPAYMFEASIEFFEFFAGDLFPGAQLEDEEPLDVDMPEDPVAPEE